jgi:hypothetical protein
MKKKLSYQKFIIPEQVFVSPDFRGKVDRAAYSLPDILDARDAKTLVSLIERDPELRGIALGELSSAGLGAKDFWAKIGNSPAGKDLMTRYPDIVKYRISRTDTTRDEYLEPSVSTEDPQDPNKKILTTPFEKYDKWSNKKGQFLSAKGMPSFREWINNPREWNPEEVSGGATKTTPVSSPK